MDNTTNSEQPEVRRSLHAVVSRHCAHIRKPYTLEEICEEVQGNEYNAELMLQHLLLWVSANGESSDASDAFAATICSAVRPESSQKPNETGSK